jgi:hypothetical protein
MDVMEAAGLRKCSRCEKAKPVTDFALMKGDRLARRKQCGECNAARRKRDSDNGATQKWKRANPQKVESARLRYRYGITIERRAEMAVEQGHRCACCRRERKLFVDHCHDTGRVRGLLCRHCNIALGLLDDSPLLVAQLLEYANGID